MILVDTSVLVDALSGRRSLAVAVLVRLVDDAEPFFLAPPIVREVLQGARDEAEWRRLHAYLSTQAWVDVEDRMASEIAAARIYVDCRRAGFTVRSSADCLIAQIALENDLSLLTSDRDFRAIQKVRPLRTLP